MYVTPRQRRPRMRMSRTQLYGQHNDAQEMNPEGVPVIFLIKSRTLDSRQDFQPHTEVRENFVILRETLKIMVTWLLIVIGLSILFQQVRADCSYDGRDSITPMFGDLNTKIQCEIPGTSPTRIYLVDQTVLVLEVIHEQSTNQTIVSTITAFDESEQEGRLASKLEALMPVVKRYQPDGWQSFLRLNKTMKYLGRLTPVECLKAVRLETGTHLPRRKRELAEVIDFLKKDNGRDSQTVFMENARILEKLKPSGNIVRPCAGLKNPRLIDLGENLRGFETCVVSKQGVKVEGLTQFKYPKLNLFECIRQAASGNSSMKWHFLFELKQGSSPLSGMCYILPDLKSVHIKPWKAKEWPGETETMIGRLGCECYIPHMSVMNDVDSGKRCDNLFLNLFVTMGDQTQSFRSLARTSITYKKSATLTCQALYWDDSRTLLPSTQQQLAAECIAIQDDPVHRIAPEENTLRQLIEKIQSRQLAPPNEETISYLLKNQLIDTTTGKQLLRAKDRQKRSLFGLLTSMVRSLPRGYSLFNRISARSLTYGPIMSRISSAVSRLSSLKTGLKIIGKKAKTVGKKLGGKYGKAAFALTAGGLMVNQVYKEVDDYVNPKENIGDGELVHTLQGFVELMETLYEEDENTNEQNEMDKWTDEFEKKRGERVEELEIFFSKEFPTRTDVQQTLTLAAEETEFFQQTARVIDTFGKAETIVGAADSQVLSWEEEGYTLDPMAHIQTDNYGVLAAQKLRLAARRQGSQKSFYFFPLVMDTFSGEVLKVVLPKDLKWENQTKLQNLNPCITAILLKEELQDACQFHWEKARQVRISATGVYAVIEVHLREAIVQAICPKKTLLIRSKGGLIMLANRNCLILVDGITHQDPTGGVETGTTFTIRVLLNVPIAESPLSQLAANHSTLTYTTALMTSVLYLVIIILLVVIFLQRRKRLKNLAQNLQSYWVNAENEFISGEAINEKI